MPYMDMTQVKLLFVKPTRKTNLATQVYQKGLECCGGLNQFAEGGDSNNSVNASGPGSRVDLNN